MKLNKKTLENSMTRIHEEKLLTLIKTNTAKWYVSQAYNYLRNSYKLGSRNEEVYQGHPWMMEKVFCNYMRREEQ